MSLFKKQMQLFSWFGGSDIGTVELNHGKNDGENSNMHMLLLTATYVRENLLELIIKKINI